MDCYCCFDALLLSLSLSLSLSAIFLFGLCERVVLEYVRQARTACVAVGATRLSFADAIKLHNTVALRLLSLSLSLSLSQCLWFHLCRSIPCEESWAMYAGGLETHNRGRRFFTRSFFRRRGKDRTKPKKSCWEFSLSLPLEWEYDHQSAQTQAQIKHKGARERSLLQGQLYNPFLISYAKKAQKDWWWSSLKNKDWWWSSLLMMKLEEERSWWCHLKKKDFDDEERLMMELEKDYWWWRLKTRTIV